MKLKKLVILSGLIFSLLNCKDYNQEQIKKGNKSKDNQQEISVTKNIDSIIIDGIANEKTWKKSSWMPINQLWIGEQVDSLDFTGRYKLSWSKEALYVLA